MRARIASLIVTILLGIPGLAAAQATVQIRLADSAGRPVDGTVTLTGQGTTRRCVTTAGRCTLSVPAGSYSATVAPRSGTPPPPRSVVVPAAGVVSLSLSLPPAITTVQATGTAGGSTGSTGSTSGTGARPTAMGTVVTGTVTTTPTVPTTPMPMATATARPATRNLGSGSRLVASGQVTDGASRPADGTVTVLQGTTTVGTASTTAGRFSLFDLANGTYTVQVTTRAGRTARVSLTVGAAAARLTIRVP
jgi:hypothetical protein